MPFVPDSQDKPTPGFVADSAPHDPFQKTRDFLGPMDIGGAIENAAGGLVAPAASRIGRVAQNAALSGARSFGDAEGSIYDKAKAGGLSALLGGGLSAVGETASAAGSKLADYLMQKAVGMRKNTPGVGNKLVDQGLWGTKGRLSGQVDRKLPEAEETVQGIVKGLPDRVDPSQISAQIAERGNKFVLPNGEIPPNMQGYANKVQSSAEGVRKLGGYEPGVPASSSEITTGRTQYGEPISETRLNPGSEEKPGSLSMEDVLKLKRQGDWEGFTQGGTPATSLEAELGRAQADASRGILEKASGGASKEALANEQALILARNALKKPETIHQGMGSSAFFGKYPGQSLFGSLGAQASQKAGSAAESAVDPRILQSLFGKKSEK